MCLSKAYIDTDGKTELLMEEVASIGFEQDRLLLKTLFGEQKELKARVRQIDFVKNSITLEKEKP